MLAVLGRLSLTHWILIAMVVGGLLGWLVPEASQALKPFSSIFLRLIKSLIAPLLFSTLVVGIAGHCEDLRVMGRLAVRSLVYFEVVTTLALFIGLGAVNLARPGVGIDTTRAGADFNDNVFVIVRVFWSQHEEEFFFELRELVFDFGNFHFRKLCEFVVTAR